MATALRDPADTAPIEAAARALVAQGDDIALDLVFEAFADERIEDGYFPYTSRLLEAAPSRIESHGNARVRRGARLFIDWKAGGER